MHIVDRPSLAPGHCIVSLASEDPEGFIDSGLSPACVDPRVYVSVSWVVEHARKLGLVDGTALDEARARIAELEDELAEADKVVGAVYTLKNNNFTGGKKPGRPLKDAA